MAAYSPPLALTIISSISIGVAALVAMWIAADIIWRKGWRSMMAIMIPVYVVNALYLWPITLWTYLSYGRPQPSHISPDCHTKKNEQAEHKSVQHSDADRSGVAHDPKHDHEGHHQHGRSRPMFATVTIGVCHCGAGCVLGDIIGEWLVYGTNAYFGNPPRALWVEYLVDFGFAFLFGLVFQFFSIAPMAGKYGPSVLLRVLKADALSLLFFEIGLFGWMAIFQIAIFQWNLEMNSVTCWWMMQIGMFLGHWTADPINYLLIGKGVKEPCA